MFAFKKEVVEIAVLPIKFDLMYRNNWQKNSYKKNIERWNSECYEAKKNMEKISVWASQNTPYPHILKIK